MGPTSINATLGSTATFNCIATAGIVGWLVNGSTLTELNSKELTTSSIGTTFSLHVPATEMYNNAVVKCQVSFPSSAETSDPAVLRVQGTYVLHMKRCCARKIT